MVQYLMKYMQDKDGSLVNGCCLARKPSVSETNLDTYPSDWSVPQELLDAASIRRTQVIFGEEPRRHIRTTDENARRWTKVRLAATRRVQGTVNQKMTRAKTSGHIPSMRTGSLIRLKTPNFGTTTPKCSSEIGRRPGHECCGGGETALRMSKSVPGGTDNVLVVLHGNILSDFHNDDAWVAGFVQLFPDGFGGPEDPSRKQPVSFKRWARALLNQRDDRWRKVCYFLFCVAAIIFRHDALSNVEFKLRGWMSHSTAETLSKFTKEVLEAFVAELQLGKRVSAVLDGHADIRLLLRTLQVVSQGASWTGHGRHAARMQAISMMVIFGQPFCFVNDKPV